MTFDDIYITGSHRSGSSWIGKILSPAGNFLIRDEEIFNCTSEIARSPFEVMYPFVCRENEERYYPYVERVVHKHYNLIGGLLRARTPRDVARVAKRKLHSLARRRDGDRPQIFVEPIGLFSTEWFAERFHAKVIVVIRHPASFVSSLKRLDWGFDFSHLSRQGKLMERYLHPFQNELRNPPQRPDIVGMGILQWKIFYGVVDIFRREHPEWVFVRQEDLASDPATEFRKLHERLDLPFTDKTTRLIEELSSETNPTEFKGRRDESRRNSRATVRIWKERLTPPEIVRIREGVEEISRRFYDDRSWE